MGPGVGRSLYDRAAAHLQDVGYAQASLWVLRTQHTCQVLVRATRLVLHRRAEAGVRAGGIDDVRYTLPMPPPRVVTPRD